MLKNIGLFCKRALQKRPVFCKETCIFKHPTHRSHPIACILGLSSPYSRETVTYFFFQEVPEVHTPPYLWSLEVNTPPYWGRHTAPTESLQSRLCNPFFFSGGSISQYTTLFVVPESQYITLLGTTHCPYGVPSVETLLPIFFLERNLDFTKSSYRMSFSSLRVEILLPVNTDNGYFPPPFQVSTPFNSTVFLRTDGGYPKCSKDAGVPSFTLATCRTLRAPFASAST